MGLGATLPSHIPACRSELYCEGAEGSKVLLKTLKPLIEVWLLSSFSDEFSVEWADGPKARM